MTTLTSQDYQAEKEPMIQYLNQRYQRDWNWKVSHINEGERTVMCIGQLTLSGQHIIDSFVEIPKEGLDRPFTEVEFTAFREAAIKSGWTESVLQNVSQESDKTVQKPQLETIIKVPQTTTERAAELKAAYRMSTKSEFLTFIQLCHPEITSFEQITAAIIDEAHALAAEKPETFASFQAALPV